MADVHEITTFEQYGSGLWRWECSCGRREDGYDLEGPATDDSEAHANTGPED